MFNNMKIEQLQNLKKEVEVAVKLLLGEKLRKLILYGSYARGDFHNDSDVDFAVVTDIELEQINIFDEKLAEICLELSLKYDVVVTIILISEKNFNGYCDILPYYRNLVKEGIPVYGIQ